MGYNFAMLKTLGVSVLIAVLAFQADPHASKIKQGKADQQPPAPIAAASIKQSDSPPPQAKSQEHVPNDVWIVKTPDKDAFDIASFVVSFVVAAVGVLGVIVGIMTVLYIKRQAFEMGVQRTVMRRTLNTIRRQSNIMEQQAADARENSKSSSQSAAETLEALKRQADMIEAQNKTVRDRERARILIREVWPPLLATKSEKFNPDVPLKISMQVANDGSSMATKVKAEGHTYFLDSSSIFHHNSIDADDDPSDWYKLKIPQTIYPSASEAHRAIEGRRSVEVLVTHMAGVVDETYEPIDRSLAEAIVKGEVCIVIRGEITYEDIFGEAHETPFHLVWIAGKGEAGMGIWKEHSGWFDLSGKET